MTDPNDKQPPDQVGGNQISGRTVHAGPGEWAVIVGGRTGDAASADPPRSRKPRKRSKPADTAKQHTITGNVVTGNHVSSGSGNATVIGGDATVINGDFVADTVSTSDAGGWDIKATPAASSDQPTFRVGQIVEFESGQFLGEHAEVRDVGPSRARVRFIRRAEELDVDDPAWRLSVVAEDAGDRSVEDLSEDTKRWLATMTPDECYSLAPTSPEHEYVYGFRGTWEDQEHAEQVARRQIADAPPTGPVPVMYGDATAHLLRKAGRCSYQTGYGLPGYEYCGQPFDSHEVVNEDYCVLHDRAAAGVEDPEINVGDRVRDAGDETDDDEPGRYGTVTYVDNNGFRVRWDGQEQDFEADYGDIEPADDDDAAPTVQRALWSPAAPGSTWGEVTALPRALAYTSAMASNCSDGMHSLEASLAGLTEGRVGGPALTHLASCQDLLGRLRDEFTAAHQELVRHQTVRDAYQANPDAGAKAFLLEG